MLHKVLPVEWKAAEEGALTAYASTFGNVDLGGDVVARGAFAKTINHIKASGIPLLADHLATTGSVIGTIFDAAEDATGLHIKARMSSAPDAQSVRTKLVEGHLSKLSIGYESMADHYEDRDGRRVRVLDEVKLWEVSVVVFPMNPEAIVTGAKTATPASVLSLRLRLVEEELALSLDSLWPWPDQRP